MEFRPCIDIHNGKVKQIVGSSLRDRDGKACENFVSERGSVCFAKLYRRHGLRGGHIILLNPEGSPHYNETKRQALMALCACPGLFQVGGGITPENAREFLEAGASHVIVTSYVFRDGVVNRDNLERLCAVTGRRHLVLDLSCRKKDGAYYIVTDRWQRFTSERVTHGLLDQLAGYADEFLVHAVDVEGRTSGIERGLVEILGGWGKIPVTYAGGVGDFSDLEHLREWGRDCLNVTVGSALDLFGGTMAFERVLELCR